MAFQRRPPLAFLLPAAGAAALVAWTFHAYPPRSGLLVLASLALAATSFACSRCLLGTRATCRFAAIAVALGWCAEQAGATQGWLFGAYHYTEVLGPRLGQVPIVIPLMWFGLTQVGLLLASLLLWRQPAPPAGSGPVALTALLAAMLVTAFDLGADPYFVYQLQAWVMVERDGDWFGETVRGFEGWLAVSFTIVALFLALGRPAPAAPTPAARRAALGGVLVYAGFLLFQATQVQPVALRVVALFAMGIPTLAAAAAWAQWGRRDAAAPLPAEARA